jgi:hypothetical protein
MSRLKLAEFPITIVWPPQTPTKGPPVFFFFFFFEEGKEKKRNLETLSDMVADRRGSLCISSFRKFKRNYSRGMCDIPNQRRDVAFVLVQGGGQQRREEGHVLRGELRVLLGDLRHDLEDVRHELRGVGAQDSREDGHHGLLHRRKVTPKPQSRRGSSF